MSVCMSVLATVCVVVSAGGNKSFINSGVMSLDILDIPDMIDPPISVIIKHINVSRSSLDFVALTRCHHHHVRLSDRMTERICKSTSK